MCVCVLCLGAFNFVGFFFVGNLSFVVSRDHKHNKHRLETVLTILFNSLAQQSPFVVNEIMRYSGV